jgi:hypothetical protein
MNYKENTQKELIEIDLEWLKKDIEHLTIDERCLILEEYISCVKKYGIGVTEYTAFIKAFDEVEE